MSEVNDANTFRCKNMKFTFDRNQLPKIPYLKALAEGRFRSPTGVQNDLVSITDPGIHPSLLELVISYVKSPKPRAKYFFINRPIGFDYKLTDIFNLPDFLLVEKPRASTTLIKLE